MSDTDTTADLLRDAAVDFLGGRAGRDRLRGWVGRPRPVDLALWRESAALGWTAALLPEDLGGLGLGLAEAAVLAEEAGRRLYAEPLVAAAFLPALLLAAAAPGAVTSALAQTLAEGSRLLAVAWQESAGTLTLATPDCKVVDGRLTGRKRFVAGAAVDALLLVWAQCEGAPVWVAVDAQASGVRATVDAAGLGSPWTFDFDSAPLLDPTPLLRGAAAHRALTRLLTAGRLLAAAELAGNAAGCLAQTLDHLRTRQQFDRTIGSFQAVQHRCVDLHMDVELATASLARALSAWLRHSETGLARPDPGEPKVGTAVDAAAEASVEAATCAAKARAGDAAVKVGREAVQLHGAMGFCEEVDIGLYLRAALHGNAWLGGPTSLRRRFAELQAQPLTAEAPHA